MHLAGYEFYFKLLTLALGGHKATVGCSEGQRSLSLDPSAFICIFFFLKSCYVSMEEWDEALVLYFLGFFNETAGGGIDSGGKREASPFFQSSFSLLITDYELSELWWLCFHWHR